MGIRSTDNNDMARFDLSSASLEGLKILVVEDEAIVSFMIEQVLSDLGCSAIWLAASVAEADETLNRHQPDMAILDVNVGGDLIFPVAERLQNGGIPFVFTTGYGRTGLLQSWLHCKIVHKPYDVEMLLNALSSAWMLKQAGPNSPQQLCINYQRGSNSASRV